MASPVFKPSRGIREGNPLSPYIFILCLNRLSLSLDHALHTKQLSPIRVGKQPIDFNHILFFFFFFGEKKTSLKQTNQEQGNAC